MTENPYRTPPSQASLEMQKKHIDRYGLSLIGKEVNISSLTLDSDGDEFVICGCTLLHFDGTRAIVQREVSARHYEIRLLLKVTSIGQEIKKPLVGESKENE